MKKFILTNLVMFISLFTYAQQFYTPLTTLTGDAVATTSDGRVISGDIRMVSMGMKGLMSFRIKDAVTEEVHKFEAEEVKTLSIRMDGIAKFETLSQQTSNISRMSKANFKEYETREFIYFHQVEWPDKPGKFLLVQLLNEGWDSKVKVYDYPIKKTGTTSIGGIAVMGGEAKSFIVDFEGKTSIVDRNNYKKTHFDRMFSGCENVMALEEKYKSFEDFALHVFTYEKECN
jgi:hypothetical protein